MFLGRILKYSASEVLILSFVRTEIWLNVNRLRRFKNLVPPEVHNSLQTKLRNDTLTHSASTRSRERSIQAEATHIALREHNPTTREDIVMSSKTAESVGEPDFCNHEITTRCALVPGKFTECKNYLKDFDEYQFPYSSDDADYQYPSASASYSGNDNERNIVSLLNTDFMEIYDELAKVDDSFYFGPSPVAMPITYDMPEAEMVSLEDSIEMIQYATIIDLPDPKVMKLDCDLGDNSEYLIYQQTQRNNRVTAISKWRFKRSQAVRKATDKNILSARQEATARRPRTHGKFKKVRAKWISATEYFHLEPKEFKSDVEEMSSTDDMNKI